MEYQDVEQHQGIHTQVCENVSRLLKCMVTATAGVMGPGSHVCNEKVCFNLIQQNYSKISI